MHLLYVMDPLETMHPKKDTSFAFMRAAQKHGHVNWHCLLRDLTVEPDGVFAMAHQATVSETPPHAVYGERKRLNLSHVDAILIRKDPPFDTAYLHATQILDLVSSDTFIMNTPRGLRDAEEKLYALRFAKWMPRTCVTSDAQRIIEFMHECGGAAVIKPIGRAGGLGVMKLSASDINTWAIIELLTDAGRQPVMVQQYLEEVREGDKRVLLLDGDLLGAVLRVPKQGDLRANIHVGGSVQQCELTRVEMEMVASIGPYLRRAGLYFVGLDVIGQRLTEVNVTSPTCIQELGQLTGTHPENTVITWLEGKVQAFQTDAASRYSTTKDTTDEITCGK